MASLGSVEIAVRLALETLGPQIAKLENELAKLKDAKIKVTVLESRDGIKSLKADLLEAQAIGKKGFFGGAAKDAAELQKQAALLREQVRFRQQLSQIKTFSPKEAQQARAIAKEINSINVARINAEFTKTGGILSRLKDQAQGFGDNIQQGIGQGIGQGVAGVGGAIAAAPFKAAGAVIGGLAGIVGGAAKEYASLEESLVAAGVASDSIGTPAYDRLKDTVKQLGIDTSKAPKEIADTAVSLARAGFTADEAAASLEGIVRASEAVGESVEVTGDVIGSTYRTLEQQFRDAGLGIEESSKFIANSLVQTAQVTNTSFAGLGESLSEVGPSAAAAGQPLEDVLVVLGLLGDAGIRGSEAGTALRAGFDQLTLVSAASRSELEGLTGGTNEASRALEVIGANVRDAEGNMRPILEVLPEIRAGLANLSSGDRAIVLDALFGTEGGKAFNTLLGVTTDRVEAVTASVKGAQEGVGAAVRSGEAQLQGFQGQLKLIGGSAQTLSSTLGEALAPAFEGAVGFANQLLVSLIENDSIFKGINEQAIAFQDYLKENPDILASTQEALGEVVSTLATEASLAAQDLLGFLKENPQAIQDGVNAFKDMVVVLGQAVGLMAQLVGGAVKVAQGIGSTFQAGGTTGAAAKAVVGSVAGVDEAELNRRIEARRQAEVIQPEKSILSKARATGAFGFNPIVGLAVQGATAIRGRRRTADIVEEESARSIDEAAARNRAKNREKAIASEQKGPLLPGQTREALADQAKERKDGAKELDAANKDLEKAQELPAPKKLRASDIGKQELAAIEESAARRNEAIKKATLSGQLTAEQAEKQAAQSAVQAGQQRIAALEAAQAKIAQLQEEGALSEAEAAKRSKAIGEQLLKEKSAQLDRQLALQKAAKDAAIKALEAQAEAEERATAKRSQQGAIAVKRRVAGGELSEDSAQRELLAVEQQAGAERIASLQAQQQRITQLRQQGVLSAAEAGDRLAGIEQQLSSAIEQQLDRQIAARQQANQAAIKAFDQGIKTQQAALKGQQQAREGAGLQARLSGELPEAVALKDIEGTTQGILGQIDLVRSQLAGIDKLRQQGALSAEEATNRQLELTGQLGDLNNDVFRSELNRREAVVGLIRRQADLQQQLSDVTLQGAQQQVQVLGQLTESLDQQNRILQAREGLQSAGGDAAIANAQREVKGLQEAETLRERLSSGEAGEAEKKVIGRRLRELGVPQTGADLAGEGDELKLLDKRQAAEDKLARAELDQLTRKQELERASFELQAQGNRLRANALLIEQQIEASKARQAVLQAEQNLEAAKAGGNTQEIEIAQKGLDIAKQQEAIAQRSVGLAEKNVQTVQQEESLGRQTLDTQQRSQLETFADDDRRRNFDQDLERARFVDEKGVSAPTPLPATPSAAQAALAEQDRRRLFGATASLTGGAGAPPPPEAAARLEAALAGAGTSETTNNVQPTTIVNNITVSTPQPVQDAGKILADASRQRLM